MAKELLAHNAHLVLTQDSQLSKYTDSLQTSHITIIEALDGVKRIYQDDAMLPKADFVAKYIEHYDEPCLRFMRDILCSVVNPIAYGILRLSQLRGWDFYPTPQKTMLKLFD